MSETNGSGIRFDSEGGIVANGFHIPAEPVRKVATSLMDLSRAYHNYGFNYDAGTTDDEKIQDVLAKRDGGDYIDRGSLLRIAIAAEFTRAHTEAIQNVLCRILEELRAPRPAAEPPKKRIPWERLWTTWPEGVAELLAKPIADLEPPVRVHNCLEGGGIGTVGDLVLRSADDLLELRNFGAASLTEVRTILAARGLKLRGD